MDSRLIHCGTPGEPSASLQKDGQPCGVPRHPGLSEQVSCHSDEQSGGRHPRACSWTGASLAPLGQILEVGFGGPLGLLKRNTPDGGLEVRSLLTAPEAGSPRSSLQHVPFLG